jgi:hypothetical protein
LAAPALVSKLDLGAGKQLLSAAVYDGTLYTSEFELDSSRNVVSGSRGLRIYDFSDPASLSATGFISLTATAYHLRVIGSQLVTCDGDDQLVSLWDLSAPTAPVLLTSASASSRVCAVHEGVNIVANGKVLRPNGQAIDTVATFMPGGSQLDGFPYGSAVNASFIFLAQSARVLVLNGIRTPLLYLPLTGR